MTQDSSQHPTQQKNGLTYKQAGVDISAGNDLVEAIKPIVKSTKRPGSDTQIGGFGGLFDLKAAGFTDPILVAANDGVGTKVKIAIETGIHDTVGIDLVAMCVNDLIVQGAQPLFFLDYFATGKLDVAAGTTIIKGIAEGCKQADCALIGGETAEMPGLYAGDDYDLAGFSVGAAERGTLLPRDDIAQGDLLIGLASSGVHSNGFSLVRKVVELSGLTWTDAAPFAPETPLGQALLEPTRIYVKTIMALINTTGAAKSLCHITGGGFTENLPRVLPDALAANIDLAKVPLLPVFDWLAKTAGLDQAEMVRTFNCGIGMVIVIAPDDLEQVSAELASHGETAHVIGALGLRETEAVTYANALAVSP